MARIGSDNRLHAPANSRIALLSAYVGGADFLYLPVGHTADGVAIVGPDSALTLAELRKVDISRDFAPRGSPGFRYKPAGRAPVRTEVLADLLDLLPEDVTLVVPQNIDLHDPRMIPGTPEQLGRFTGSILDAKPPGQPWITADFGGHETAARHFALGYAKANRFCVVEQDDGIHVRIAPYDGPLTSPNDAMHFALRDWPYYSGGGVGLVTGIRGDFVAEVDFASVVAQQATMCELAVTNVDPPGLSFFDPHGAPPFVGVEHDEDDGYRINWNLGSSYDQNRYGSPVGDGTVLAGRFRLERRGSYFAAYYRNNTDASDWVCVGAVRNESMNHTVYLRCVGKRWRQERTDGPGFFPIPANEFTFGRLTIWRRQQPPSWE